MDYVFRFAEMSLQGFVKHLLSFLSFAHLLQSPLVNNHSLGELWLLMGILKCIGKMKGTELLAYVLPAILPRAKML